jgi:hypothetical protein
MELSTDRRSLSGTRRCHSECEVENELRRISAVSPEVLSNPGRRFLLTVASQGWIGQFTNYLKMINN